VRCRTCKRVVPGWLPGCPYLDCEDFGPESLENVAPSRAFAEFTCPRCDGVVIYMGVVPTALECDTPGCPNYRLR